MQNVITFKNLIELPDDLMTFKKFSEKYGISKSYLYKLFYAKKIKRYKFGQFKLSEKEALKALSGG